MNYDYKSLFLLDPKFIYLNHGSFGACFHDVHLKRINWIEKLKQNPVHFIDDIVIDELKKSRIKLSTYVGCNYNDIVYVPNPTTAINTITKSIHDLNPKDEILTTNHEYGAMNKTWEYFCKRKGLVYNKQEIQIPVSDHKSFVEEFWKGVNKKTKIIFISHITSSTALIFPIKEICKRAKDCGILTIIDGAHVPGHIYLNLSDINPDIYVGACHKWMCTPKGTAFLYVKKKIQSKIIPLVISWGWESEYPSKSKFIDRHEFQGTNDFCSYLVVPDAINLMQKHEWNKVSLNCHNLLKESYMEIIEVFNTSPISPINSQWLGQMISIPINCSNPELLQKKLFEKNIVIPIIKWENFYFIRISIQAYNSYEDIIFLKKILKEIIK